MISDQEWRSPTGKTRVISTWQGMARNPEKFHRNIRCAVLFFDDCHLGGSRKLNSSYKKIVAAVNPRKKVQVSATTIIASQLLLGDREGVTFIYRMSEAYEDGC